MKFSLNMSKDREMEVEVGTPKIFIVDDHHYEVIIKDKEPEMSGHNHAG